MARATALLYYPLDFPVFDLVFLHCHFYPRCTARVDKHFDGYWTLQLMTGGAVELFYDDERHELRHESHHDLRDTCWFWPAFPGPRIRFHAAPDVSAWEHRYAAFTGQLISHWKEAGLWPTRPQKAPRGQAMGADFDRLLALIHADTTRSNVRSGTGSGGSWARRRTINALEAILLELAEARAGEADASALWIARVRDWMSEQSDFAPDYMALARELGMGLSTLRRKWKAETGQSLHETFLHHRLTDARRMLGETDLPLKVVADQLGYRDVYFFSKQFKQFAGVSPGVYRKSRQ